MKNERESERQTVTDGGYSSRESYAKLCRPTTYLALNSSNCDSSVVEAVVAAAEALGQRGVRGRDFVFSRWKIAGDVGRRRATADGATALGNLANAPARSARAGRTGAVFIVYVLVSPEKRNRFFMTSSRVFLPVQGRRRLLDELLASMRPQLDCLRFALAARGGFQSRCIQSGGDVRSQQGQVDALKALIPDVAKQNPREIGQEARERQNAAVVGTAWEARSLRKKSFDDLHALWLTLYKERNALHAEKLAWKRAGQRMPQATRLSKTRLSMNRIKQVMSERLNDAGYSVEEKGLLKAFIDAM